MENKRKQDFLNKIKEKVDFLYSLTFNNEFKESFEKFNDRLLDEVRAVMVKRNIILKNNYYPGQAMGRKCSFTWNPTAPEPTKTLYSSIAKEISRQHKEKAERYAEGKLKKAPDYLKKVEVAPVEANEHPIQIVKDVKKWFKDVEENAQLSYQERLQLSMISDQELWDELKSRGYEISDGKLAKVVKTYLD